MTEARLWPRQREVLFWAARGHNTKTTAIVMGVSPRTVEVHRQIAVRAMDAENVTHAVVRALAGGIITLEELRGEPT